MDGYMIRMLLHFQQAKSYNIMADIV